MRDAAAGHSCTHVYVIRTHPFNACMCVLYLHVRRQVAVEVDAHHRLSFGWWLQTCAHYLQHIHMMHARAVLRVRRQVATRLTLTSGTLQPNTVVRMCMSCLVRTICRMLA
jgi:hypothetical protein